MGRGEFFGEMAITVRVENPNQGPVNHTQVPLLCLFPLPSTPCAAWSPSFVGNKGNCAWCLYMVWLWTGIG